MIIGKRLKDARIKKGYSQQELGDLLEVSKVSVCGYETGNRTPTIDTFIKVLNELDMDANYLLGRDAYIVADTEEPYMVKVAQEDIELLTSFKNHPDLYNKLIADPKRSVELISRKLK